MLVIKADNVTHAYNQGRVLIKDQGRLAESRNGKVLKFPYPVATAYTYPQERVLFDPVRDANPFLHLFEAIWMLAGRNDVDWIGQFASQMYAYSDDGKTLHGAYGHRWRQHFGVDQINQAIFDLYADKGTRRVVVGMWDPYIDGKVAQVGGKDVPCNTQIYFNVRPDGELDMTVSNRSNDMIWGAYGANAVHMSILHEYVALSAGLPMGAYYQFSNDLHVYEKHFNLLDLPAAPDFYAEFSHRSKQPFEPLFIFGQKEVFDKDVEDFVADPWGQVNYRTEFFRTTVGPMARAWKLHKAKFHTSAVDVAGQIEAEDWRKAATEWIARRPPKVIKIEGSE